MQRLLRIALIGAFALGVLNLGLTAEPASACPMCKTANETAGETEADRRPKAYMYSILFMLSVPATLVAGFGIGFYRLSKKQAALEETTDTAGETPGEPHPDAG